MIIGQVVHLKMSTIFQIILLAMTGLFLMALFKPGVEFGMYEWLVRPNYIIKLSKAISATSLVLLVLVFGSLLLKSSLLFVVRKDVFFINSFFLLGVGSVHLISALSGGDIYFLMLRLVTICGIAFMMVLFFSAVLNMEGGGKGLSSLLIPPMLAGVIFIMINLFLYIFDRSSVIAGFGRMYGVTEHPNFFGVNCAIILVLIYTALGFVNKAGKQATQFKKEGLFVIFRRPYLLLFLAASLFLMLLSGSRTALLIFFTAVVGGVIMQKGKRTSDFLLLFLIISGVTLLIVYYSQITGLEDVRGISSENTRTQAWLGMLDVILENPILGVGFENIGYSENSFLRAFSAAGIVGGGIFMLLILYFIKISLNSRSWHSTQYGYSISPLILGLLLAANFEGYLLDTLSYPALIFHYLFNLTYIMNVSSTTKDIVKS
jgi:hypothetical protein